MKNERKANFQAAIHNLNCDIKLSLLQIALSRFRGCARVCFSCAYMCYNGNKRDKRSRVVSFWLNDWLIRVVRNLIDLNRLYSIQLNSSHFVPNCYLFFQSKINDTGSHINWKHLRSEVEVEKSKLKFATTTKAHLQSIIIIFYLQEKVYQYKNIENTQESERLWEWREKWKKK